LIITTSQVK